MKCKVQLYTVRLHWHNWSVRSRGQTDRVTELPHLYALGIDLLPRLTTLTFSPRRAMVMTHRPTPWHTYRKFEGQSVQKTEWKQTDGQTDGRTDRRTLLFTLPSLLTRSVNI